MFALSSSIISNACSIVILEYGLASPFAPSYPTFPSPPTGKSSKNKNKNIIYKL